MPAGSSSAKKLSHWGMERFWPVTKTRAIMVVCPRSMTRRGGVAPLRESVTFVSGLLSVSPERTCPAEFLITQADGSIPRGFVWADVFIGVNVHVGVRVRVGVRVDVDVRVGVDARIIAARTSCTADSPAPEGNTRVGDMPCETLIGANTTTKKQAANRQRVYLRIMSSWFF